MYRSCAVAGFPCAATHEQARYHVVVQSVYRLFIVCGNANRVTIHNQQRIAFLRAELVESGPRHAAITSRL